LFARIGATPRRAALKVAPRDVERKSFSVGGREIISGNGVSRG
jgi:hypothetical protein